MSRRVRSSSWSAPTLRPPISTVASIDSGTLRRSHGGGSPRTVSSVAIGSSASRDSSKAKRCERRRVEPLDVVDGEADRRRRAARQSQRPRGTPSRPRARRPGPPARRAATRPRARAAGSAAARAATSSTTPPSRSASPAYESRVSASDGRHESTRYPRSHGSVDPGQPDATSCRSPPGRGARRRREARRAHRGAASIAPSSSSLPMSGRAVTGTREYPAPPWPTSSSCPTSARASPRRRSRGGSSRRDRRSRRTSRSSRCRPTRRRSRSRRRERERCSRSSSRRARSRPSGPCSS